MRFRELGIIPAGNIKDDMRLFYILTLSDLKYTF